jgi:glutaredoxin 3
MSNNSERVVMYRTRGCPFCVAAEQLLQQRGVAVQQIYLDEHTDRRGFTSSILPGHYTVPLVLIDGEAIGGYQELVALAQSGALDDFAA